MGHGSGTVRDRNKATVTWTVLDELIAKPRQPVPVSFIKFEKLKNVTGSQVINSKIIISGR